MAKDVLNKMVKGAGLTAIGMIFSKFITYFYRIIIARFIGPDAYGQLALGLVVLGVTGTFAKVGLDAGIKKFVPEARTKENLAELKGIVISSFQMITVSSIIFGSIIYLSAEFIATGIFNSPETTPIIQVFAFVPLFSRTASVFIDTTIGFNTVKYRVITVQIIQNIIQLVTTAGLVATGMGVVGAAWGWLAGVAITVPIGFYFMEKKFGPIVFSNTKAKKMHIELLNYSYPLIFTGIIGTALGWADTALIGYFMDDTAVGFYNAAFPTAMLLIIPHKAMGSLSISGFSEMGARKDSNTGKALKTITRWIFALSFPTFLIMILFSGQLLELLFGPQYTAAAPALTVLALGALFDASTGKVSALMKSAGYTKIIFYNSVVNLGLNLILNVLLIPEYGITGAAIATASSTVLANSLLVIETWKYENKTPFTAKAWKPVLAGLLSITAVYLSTDALFQHAPVWALFPAGILFFMIYTLTLLKIGGLEEYDREIILTAARKTGFEEETRKLINILT
jgi:O-antigen/teichoic acid export membrane protein